MIKQWYTARELAELELESMPKTDRAYKIRAERDNWKERDRSFGKGKEYHVSNLPEQAQISLIEQVVGQQKLKDLECKSASLQMKQERGRAKFTDQERSTARISIVALYKNFRASCGLGVKAAEAPFIKLYLAEKSKGNSDIIPEWIFEIYPEISTRSLHRWRSVKLSAKSSDKMGTKYGNRKGTGILDRANNGEVVNFIAALITKQTHLTAGHVRDLCFNEFGKFVYVKDAKTEEIEEKPFPKIRAFERFIAKWKDDNKGLYLNLTDPDSYKNKYQVAFGKADAGIVNLNQCWEIDASPVDAMCNDGRWNLYSILDIYSRRVIFTVSRTPCTEASLLIIRRAILEWGVPERIKTDNGADFISYRFKSALISLGIEQDICSPFTPEGKGFVERSFKSLQHDLMPLLPGFIGHNVTDRSKIEGSKAFGQRLGESAKDAFKIDMDAEELQKHVDDWAYNRYGDRIHGTIKETPNNKARNWVGSIKKIENERVIDVLLSPIASGKGYRQVTKTGIRVENASFIAPELALYVRETVFIRHSPDDMGRIYVFKDETGEFICEAKNADRMNVSRKEVALEAKKAQKEILTQQRKEIKKTQRGIKPEKMIEAVLKNNIKEAKNVVDFRSSQTHTSPGIQEAQKALNKFEPTEKTELNTQQTKAHTELVAELNKPTEILEFDEKKSRFEKALNLENRLNNGDRVSSADDNWLKRYQNLPEYRSQKRMMEDFGCSWFDEKES